MSHILSSNPYIHQYFLFSNCHSVSSGKIIIVSHSITACDLKTNSLNFTTFYWKDSPSFSLVWAKSY